MLSFICVTLLIVVDVDAAAYYLRHYAATPALTMFRHLLIFRCCLLLRRYAADMMPATRLITTPTGQRRLPVDALLRHARFLHIFRHLLFDAAMAAAVLLLRHAIFSRGADARHDADCFCLFYFAATPRFDFAA